jgi:hypothetical protein
MYTPEFLPVITHESPIKWRGCMVQRADQSQPVWYERDNLISLIHAMKADFMDTDSFDDCQWWREFETAECAFWDNAGVYDHHDYRTIHTMPCVA